MKNILIAISMEDEKKPLIDYLDKKDNWTKSGDRYVNGDISLKIGLVGIGKVNSAINTTRYLCQESFDIVVNLGIAGGMIKSLDIGGMALGTTFVQADFDLTMFGRALGEVPGSTTCKNPEKLISNIRSAVDDIGYHMEEGLVASGDLFLDNLDKKKRYVDCFAPISYDMESAAVAEACGKMDVPYVSIRVITDLADRDAPDLSDDNLDEVIDRPIEVLIAALERGI